MIVSFYDKDFNPLLNNATLSVDDESYKLIKRPVELNELTCTCEAFDQDIQPTFLIISDKRKRYVYGCLAGVPELNSENKTEINGTDIKSMLSSDIVLNYVYGFVYVSNAIDYIFKEWASQLGYKLSSPTQTVAQGIINCEVSYVDAGHGYTSQIEIDEDGYQAYYPNGKYNALEEIQSLLRYYKMYMETQVDIENKKIKFIIGQTMVNPMQTNADAVNVKLWEYGIKNYGKFIADVSECQGYLITTDQNDVETWIAGDKWILTSSGNITTNTAYRDIFPIKSRIVTSNESLYEANKLAIETLLEKQFNEDIELPATKIKPKFETLFNVYTRQGGELYKQLPCGELQYDATGLVKFKIGYRYTSINFI